MIAKCPSCGIGNNDHSSITDNAKWPEAGDLSICSTCGELAEYVDDDGTLVLFTRFEELSSNMLTLVTRVREEVKNRIDVDMKKW